MTKLSDYSFNVFSQFGEDGIIQKILEIIGSSYRTCVEFGAYDGFFHSNTANLWTNGWRGILIEADKKRFASLVENTKKYDCYVVNAFVGYEGSNTLENILKKHKLPDKIDFLSIDIDGDDYYIFESLNELKPRVICCEYNPTIPAHIELIAGKGNYFGCSPRSLSRLAETKGYRLVSMTETNCFFVTDDDFEKFSDFNTSIESLAISKHLTYLISTYDGDYILSRKPTYGFRHPANGDFIGEYFGVPQMQDHANREHLLQRLLTSSHKKITSSLRKARKLYHPLKIHLLGDPEVHFRETVRKWFLDNGDNTLRLEYKLTEEAIVFDLGGYEGKWSEQIVERYNPYIFIFEPVPEYYSSIKEKFSTNPKVRVFDFGLLNETSVVKIFLQEDGTSLYKKGGHEISVKMMDIAAFLESHQIKNIDLMKINIEGAEYLLLERMINADIVKKCRDIQVQFHHFYPNAVKLRKKIQQSLTNTHELTYNYPFVWENWALKK